VTLEESAKQQSYKSAGGSLGYNGKNGSKVKWGSTMV